MAASSGYENARQLARFARGLRREDVPDAVWRYAQTVVLDTIGCIVGAVPAATAAPVLGVVQSLAGRPEAHVLGTGMKTDCVSAAFANSYLADVLDFEDTIVSHPSVAAIPAALAVGERVGASGSDVLLAVIAAYEVGVRVQRATMPTFQRRQTVSTEFAWKAYPAVVAAGRLLDLDEDAWIEALGYAGAASPLPSAMSVSERPLTWMKSNYAGQTQIGVFAALLAQAGFQARRPMLEADGQFSRLMGSDVWAPDDLTAGLGRSWIVAEAGLKPYPCCRFIHPTLDAVEDAMRGQTLDPADVVAVRVDTFAMLVDGFDDRRPVSMIDAEFSLPYAIAMIVLDLPRDAGWYDSARLDDPGVHRLIDRVQLREEASFSAAFAQERRSGGAIEIELNDGRVLRGRRDRPRGGPDERLPIEEVQRKFLGVVDPVLGSERARQAYDLLLTLDELDDVRRIAAAVAVDVTLA